MKKMATVIVALVALAAFAGPGVAQQKGQTGVQQQKSQTSPKQTPAGSINLNSSRSNIYLEGAPQPPTPKPAGRAAACSGGCPGCPKSQCAQGPNGDCVCMGSSQ